MKPEPPVEPDVPKGDFYDMHPAWAQFFQEVEEYEADLAQYNLIQGLLAAAVRISIEQDNIPTALALMDADLSVIRGFNNYDVDLHITAPLDTVKILQAANQKQDIYASALWYLFADILPTDMELKKITVRPKLDAVDDDWRENIRAGLEGEASNQARPFDGRDRIVHNGLFYRSEGEVAIAKALDRVPNLIYLPNCGASSHGVVKEADFHIVHDKKIGILEVDGFAHKGMAADDHQKDTYFQYHGYFVKRYRWEDCIQTPDVVVKNFLELLAKS